MAQDIKTYCRFCHAYCPMVATVEDNKLIDLKPDLDNEVYGGYTCIKGRQLIEQIDHPTRVTKSQKQQAARPARQGITTTAALPELKRVIVALGNRVAMEKTLDRALNRVSLKKVDSGRW